MKCKFEGCGAEAKAKGLCGYHYKVSRYGKPVRPTRGMTLSQRLDHYTDASGGPDACWPWRGHTDTCGYGMIGVPGGKKQRAHRVRWELTYGPIGEFQVLHRCDTPGCNNPRHLFSGTPAANAADREEKGRGNQAKGEHAGRSRLTEAQARRILFGGESPIALSKELGITTGTIHHIRCRRTWKHLT